MPAAVPQLGQKRMFSGTELPQLAQECVVVCDMVFFLSIWFTGDDLTDLGERERLQHRLEDGRVYVSKAARIC